jgi:hypothetical protein
VPLEMTEGNYSNVRHRGPVYKGLGAMNPCDLSITTESFTSSTSVSRRVRKIAKSDCDLRYVCLSVRLSAWNNLAPNERIFMKFDIWTFLGKQLRKFKFY